MIRTLIVHNICLIGDLMAKALNDEQDVQVVASAATPQEAMVALTQHACDVMLVNFQLPDQGAIELVRMAAKSHEDVRIVVTGLIDSQTAILHCLELGACGYVREEDSVADLVRTLRHAARGEAMVSPAVAGALISRVAELKRLATEVNGYHDISLQEQATELTEREREILALLGQGYSNRQIAEELVITVGTVKNHVHNILDKLDVHTRKQAAMVARQLALGEAKADKGARFTWAAAMGVPVTSRREAAAML